VMYRCHSASPWAQCHHQQTEPSRRSHLMRSRCLAARTICRWCAANTC